MILGLFTLAVAMVISSVTAFYSILGLTAIFAGAFWPIIIMGGALEVGKLATVVWLHYNWERADWRIKAYLTFAAIVLMFITSMGVFGALSKYHIESGSPIENTQAQVSLFDEKIKTQRDNIDSSRKALAQMDGAVDQLLSRTTDANGATKSANLRKSQQKERGRLQTDIDQAQKSIATLQEQRAPLAATTRELESHIGPIKYIAALIYGDNADQNMLESAVRWVIIIIVFVFDPLAIVLILAATASIEWAGKHKLKKEQEIDSSELTTLTESYLAEVKLLTDCILRLETELDKTKSAMEEHHADWAVKESELQTISSSLAGIMQHVTELNGTISALQYDYRTVTQSYQQTHDELAATRDELTSVTLELAGIRSQLADFEAPVVEVPLVEVPLVEVPLSSMPVRPEVTMPKLVVTERATGFGVTFPRNPDEHDLYLRLDVMPSKLYSWENGEWVETDKSLHASYARDADYVKALTKLVLSGEYSISDLSLDEQTAVAQLLENDRNQNVV